MDYIIQINAFLAKNAWWIVPLTLFDGILKTIAMWKASHNKQRGWFIALFFLNTAGILPLIYLLFYRSNSKNGDRAQAR